MSVALPRHLPDGRHLTLEVLTEQHSIAVVEPVRIAVSVTARDLIATWHTFRVVEKLISRRPHGSWCDGFQPVKVTLSPGEFLVPLLAGSMVVHGVTVESNTAETLIKPRLGHRYLVAFNACPGQVARPAVGPFGWFEIGLDGTFVFPPDRIRGGRPFVDQILSAGSVRVLASQLAGSRRSEVPLSVASLWDK